MCGEHSRRDTVLQGERDIGVRDTGQHSRAVQCESVHAHRHPSSPDDATYAVHAPIQLQPSHLLTRHAHSRSVRHSTRHHSTLLQYGFGMRHPTLPYGVTERVCLRQKADTTERIHVVNIGSGEIKCDVMKYLA